MKARHRLEFIALLAGFTVLSALPLLGTTPESGAQPNESDGARITLQRLDTIDRQAGELLAQARIYLDHPPREYDLYFRDAVIVDAFLDQAVEALEASVNKLAGRADDPGATLPALENKIEALSADWSRFRSGLDEQLGVDPEMPRLEWGYEHVAERMPAFRQSVDQANTSVTAALVEAGSGTNPFPPFVPLAATLALAVLAWLRLRILERR